MANTKKRKRNYDDISRGSNIIFNILLALVSIMAFVPFIFVIIISFTDQQSIIQKGYSFIPNKLSLNAYQYIFKNGIFILRSYGISIVVTVAGTIIGLILVSTYAYAISRNTYAYRKFFTVVALIPMLFSGGMVANYLVIAKFLRLNDTLWALILPLAVNPFYIFVLKSFYRTNIPDSIIESAKIDGANELKIFTNIVLPLSKSGIATIALFLTLGYWNDWFNAMLYIDNQKLIPVQYMLIRIENNINFLKQIGSSQGVASEVARNIPSETIQMVIVALTVIPIACAYPFFQRYFVGGLTLGAVKE